MKILSKTLFSFLLFVILLTLGCGQNEGNGSNNNLPAPANQSEIAETANANISKDNIEELEKLVKIPILPEEATYREDDLQNNGTNNSALPNKKKLVVVLKYSAEDAQKIVEQFGNSKTVDTSEIDAESWFPPELIAKSQESGDETLKGTSYPADKFLLEPYKNGKMLRINDTDFFVLEMTTF